MLRAALFLVLAVLMGGAVAPVALAGQTADQAASIDDYKLGAGDKLKITVLNVTEITGEYSINPAGRVALPMIGNVAAAGATTDSLSESIRAKLAAGFVKEPQVTVEVINYRPFYILGEVARPGEFPYAAGLTVEQAVAAAGGYTYRAARHRAYLRRAGGKEQLVKFGDDPIYVMPGDTIRIGQRYL